MATLTRKDFVRILRRFADSPDDVLDDRADITCVINGQELTVRLSERDDVLMCQEDGGSVQRARTWIEKRLARLDLLAQKILDAVKFDKHFVDVGAMHESPSDESQREESVTESLFNRLMSGSCYSSEIIYILSEAGDGKSEIMNRLAYRMACQYKETGSGPLFLPVSLDGRPFLRIDDLVIGMLANQFRFRYCYFEAIIELVKMGSLVLGLDGFEEMVVEGKEERVISSLGELLKEFESVGRVVISARRAFYEYALKNQLPLLESIQDMRVDCDAYRLSQWAQAEFVELLKTYSVLNSKASEIYEALQQRLKPDHPILVRPVLARHLVDMLSAEVKDDGKWESVLRELNADRNPQTVMSEFVDLLVRREANSKWLVTSGPTQGRPILAVAEHMAILRAITEDMWLSSVEFVKQDYLQDWIELICSDLRKNPSETHDAREKILHHAMLLRDGDKYVFCHEAFRKFFLGQDIADYIVKQVGGYRIERVLSQDVLDFSVVEGIAYVVSKSHFTFEDVAAFLLGVKGGVSKLSPIGQNVGSILLCYTKFYSPQTNYEVRDLFFTAMATRFAVLTNLKFINCTFEVLDLTAAKNVVNVKIEHSTVMSMILRRTSCNFDCFELSEDSLPQNVEISGTTEILYDPAGIRAYLAKLNLVKPVLSAEIQSSIPEHEVDERMSTLLSLSIIFQRTSGLSDRALEVRFGKKWHAVKTDFLPQFIEDGILQKRVWHGSGGSERYALKISMGKFEAAKQKANGSYANFLHALKSL